MSLQDAVHGPLAAGRVRGVSVVYSYHPGAHLRGPRDLRAAAIAAALKSLADRDGHRPQPRLDATRDTADSSAVKQEEASPFTTLIPQAHRSVYNDQAALRMAIVDKEAITLLDDDWEKAVSYEPSNRRTAEMNSFTFGSRAGTRRAVPARAAVVLLAGILGGCGGVGTGSTSAMSSPSANASASDFTVVSTLHGLTELPHRIRWVATPSGSASDVSEVDFLIDDQLAHIEHNAPYSYGNDASWLVTSFLAPGAHSFMTKAMAVDGRTATESVTATVMAAPEPPAGLAGRWSKTVAGDDPGVWHVTINAIGWLFDDPHGGGQNQDAAYPSPAKVMIGGSIVEPALGAYDRGGAFCGEEGDPDGVFSYSVSKDGRLLTLTADAPVCYQGIVEGRWMREK